MLYKFASILAGTTALSLEEITGDLNQDAHVIWDAYMEKEEYVYDWYEYVNETRKSPNGGTLHFLNVTSLSWLDKSKAYV